MDVLKDCRDPSKAHLDKDEQTLDTWLNHLLEELMDAVNNIEKARSVLREEIEECYIRDSNSISRYPESNYWTQDTT